ncbi:MAG: LA2681 family HEPN domain-containing protein [Alphaproteobacteria bacterium]|nr:LA2681 family HEPN domain-containing protein [Alphaproteobacteria bacterium]
MSVQSLDDLARAIDTASDAGDETSLCRLGDVCEDRLRTAEGLNRVRLLYYRSNTFSSIIDIKRNDPEYISGWYQPERIENILLLRRAIGEPGFADTDSIIARQVRTNLAIRLHEIGRPVAANEERLKVLRYDPPFAKTLAGQAQAIAFYATQIYDNGHILLLLAAARSLYDEALDKTAFWESGDRELIAPKLLEERNRIADDLQRNCYDESYDFDRWSLGDTEDERAYRRWCLRERLFLNPLNDAYTQSVAATDVLHLPSHSYRIDESPRFPTYFNLLKQEYVSARYRLYRAIHEQASEFVMRDVLLLDSGEGQILGHYTEELRASFRSTYAIFDKAGLFLNDYFGLGMEPEKVTFRNVWFENPKRQKSEIRLKFKGCKNWPLRGLFFLSMDMFDREFEEVAEPDAAKLSQLRNRAEHRFLSFQSIVTGQTTDTHQFISIDEFEGKALRLLKMARETLIYLSLAMHREEKLREQGISDKRTLGIPVVSRPIRSFDRG